MELDVLERAWNHYEEKHNKKGVPWRAYEYNQDRLMEFWEDYFSGKPLYTTGVQEMIEREECECVDDGDDCPIPNPSCPLHN